eukprot:6627614-Prymnesium_polylepis.1
MPASCPPALEASRRAFRLRLMSPRVYRDREAKVSLLQLSRPARLHTLFVRVYLRLNSSNDCPQCMYTHPIHPWRAEIEIARLKTDIDTQARSTWCSNGPARETYTVATCIHCCSARIGAIPGQSRAVKPSQLSSRGP